MAGKRSSFLRRMLAAWNGDFNFDRYFSRREKYQNTRNPFLRAWYGHYCTKVQNRFGASLPLSVRMDRSVFFPHGISRIFISVGAVIGKNCTIFQQVTIGSNTLLDSALPGIPVIGDNVYIGAGAKIIGGVRVGNHVRIGANCVVVRDVPDNATVVLPAPRVILHQKERDNAFRAAYAGAAEKGEA